MGSKRNRRKKAARAKRKKEMTIKGDVIVDVLQNEEVQNNGGVLQNLIGIVEDSYRLASDATQKGMKSNPPQQPIACMEGCAWCCYLRVDVTAPEAFRIVEYIRTNLQEDQLNSLMNRVVESDSATRGLSPDERFALSLPCPLLVNDRCSVYPVRPMPCRGMNSFDASKCEEGWRNPRSLPVIPQYPVLTATYSSVHQALCLALDRAGAYGDLLELNAALRVSLETPDVVDRWMAEEPVFANARF